jgi:two-component system, response regulator
MEPYLLMLEDDEDDRHITETFFAANNFRYELKFLTNSDDVMPFLEECQAKTSSLPRVILLDKNAPVSGGMEVLKSIKSHPAFKIIPVVMISSSSHPAEINESYRLGVNSYITKPFSHERTFKKIQNFLQYWFDAVELPDISLAPTR